MGFLNESGPDVLVAVVLTIMGGATQMLLPMGPVIPGGSQALNSFLFTGIPLAIYGTYRGYFTICDMASVRATKITNVLGPMGSSCAKVALYFVGILFILVVPGARESVGNAYDSIVGDLPLIMLETYGDRWAKELSVFKRATGVFTALTVCLMMLEFVAGHAIQFAGACWRSLTKTKKA